MSFVLLPIVGVLALVAVIEGIVWSIRRGDYDWRAFGVSMFDLAGTVLLRVAAPVGLAAPLLALAYEHRLFALELDALWQFPLLFIGQEFCYYWFHRASHRIRWFWATHAVHHSPEQICFAAAFRLGLTGRITGTTIFYAPLAWLGFDPKVVLFTLTLNLLYQFWIHSERIPKLGWLEYVLNTPSHHRVHHARNLGYLDANYGGVLIIFDRLFGTFVAERADEPCDFGLVTPMRSYNPFRVELHGWLGLIADLRRARSMREVAGYLFGPPGWGPGSSGSTTEQLRDRAARGDAPGPAQA